MSDAKGEDGDDHGIGWTTDRGFGQAREASEARHQPARRDDGGMTPRAVRESGRQWHAREGRYPVDHDHPADDGLPVPEVAQVQRHQVDQEAGQNQLARNRREGGHGEQTAVGKQGPPLPTAERRPVRRVSLHGRVQHGVDEQPGDRREPRRRSGTSLRSRCGPRRCPRWTARRWWRRRPPPTNTVHPLGAIAAVGVVGDPGLGGDEDEPVADAGEDPPPHEVVVALREIRSEIADRRRHDACKEHLPRTEDGPRARRRAGPRAFLRA